MITERTVYFEKVYEVEKSDFKKYSTILGGEAWGHVIILSQSEVKQYGSDIFAKMKLAFETSTTARFSRTRIPFFYSVRDFARRQGLNERRPSEASAKNFVLKHEAERLEPFNLLLMQVLNEAFANSIFTCASSLLCYCGIVSAGNWFY